jgi:hypothetical protein
LSQEKGRRDRGKAWRKMQRNIHSKAYLQRSKRGGTKWKWQGNQTEDTGKIVRKKRKYEGKTWNAEVSNGVLKKEMRI